MKTILKLGLLFILIIISSCDPYKFAATVAVIEIKNTTDSVVTITTNLGKDDSTAIVSELSKTYNPKESYSYTIGVQSPEYVLNTLSFYVNMDFSGKVKTDKNKNRENDSVSIFSRVFYNINLSDSGKRNKNKHPDTKYYIYEITQEDINEAQ